MYSNWADAARRYEKAGPAVRGRESTILAATAILTEFIDSAEGKLAVNLLRASDRFIRLSETNTIGGRCTVYILNANGFQRSNEAAGMHTAYLRPGKPILTSVTAREAADAMTNPDIGAMESTRILEWLRLELQRIADAAPRN
ncbi:MAG: hypothetical protein HQ488_03645 [Parcubacteria group bacterium]|nr:hypothetical protein [Parcubacteria group bacterium]